MTLAIDKISSINFTSRNNDAQRNVKASEVGVATGATVGGAKYGIGAFKRFNNLKNGDMVHLSGETVNAIKEAANAGTKVNGLWSTMFANARNYKNGIINWFKSSKACKFMKPVYESKAFGKVAGAVGGVTAMFVFISGIGEMANVYSKVALKEN